MPTGINTVDNAAAIRAKIYSGVLRTLLEPELQAMNFVDMITSFPDGEAWEDAEIGAGQMHDYTENGAVSYDGLTITARQFTINNYVYSGHVITDKFTQDSYLAAQVAAKVPGIQARAIMQDIETKLFGLNKVCQTAGEENVIDGYKHRFVAGYVDGTNDDFGTITPEDISYGAIALDGLGYTGAKVLFVPPYQGYLIPKKCLTAGLSYNKAWEGVVREGALSGTKFLFSIMGVDVYISSFLETVTETLQSHGGEADKEVTAGKAAVLFANTPDRRPFRMAWRKMPKFEAEWDMDYQREKYLTVARYGVGAGDSKNLITMVCKGSPASVVE